MGRVYKVVDTLIFVICLPFYAVALPVVFVSRRFFRRRCPGCGERALRDRGGFMATCVDDAGRPYRDSYTHYSCDSCAARWRIHLDGRTEAPSEREWSAHVSQGG
jgi:hypothetical protein